VLDKRHKRFKTLNRPWKAYAAEIGRLSAKIAEQCDSASRTDDWFGKFAQESNVPRRTAYDWWNAFCQATGLSLTPSKALDIHKHQFFDWLEAQQRAAEEDKARKAQDAWEAERDREYAETRELLRQLITDYGEACVWEQVIAAVFPVRCRQEGA
jgi:hypothetical protein